MYVSIYLSQNTCLKQLAQLCDCTNMQLDWPTGTGMTAAQLHPLLDRSPYFSKEQMQKISLVDSSVQWLTSLYRKSARSDSHSQIKGIRLELSVYTIALYHKFVKFAVFG
jgi:hypothetical protein